MDAQELLLTRAEIDFLLRAHPSASVPVRAELAFGSDDDTRDQARAGLSSLIVRGLCVHDGDNVIPDEQLVGVVACLTTAKTASSVLVQQDVEHAVLVHAFAGPIRGVLLIAREFGVYLIRMFEPGTSIVDQVITVLDNHLMDTPGMSALVRGTSDRGHVGASINVAPDRNWYLADSDRAPDRSVRTTRAEATSRVKELVEQVSIR
jgi:hypothetical protein